ncbi:MAG: dUTP diphosphatase [Weeksellaceae bacterium]|nr:dUTP diphosphatase [Weeksellaceae bacterium]
MKIKVVNKSPYALPEYQTEHAAGLDLQANIEESWTLQPMERRLFPTGLYIEIPAGYEAQVRPRSGLALKHGLTCLNAPGTIDADYRGEVGVILANLSTQAYEVAPGERIAQLVFAKYEQISWEKSDALSETSRGSGGFGSTGDKP